MYVNSFLNFGTTGQSFFKYVIYSFIVENTVHVVELVMFLFLVLKWFLIKISIVDFYVFSREKLWEYLSKIISRDSLLMNGKRHSIRSHLRRSEESGSLIYSLEQ